MAFNNGDEFTPVDDMKGPEVIPKVIHQVWLGTNELPPAKMYFFRKTQTMYPDFDVKLWRESNITRDRFPLTYDVIKNLM
jgi:mannosyltransferase OCH1-like enzyme